MKALGIILLSLLVYPNLVFSQTSHCTSLYENAVRNVVISTSSYTELNQVYDQYCEANGKMKDSNWGGSLNVVIKKIPVGLTASGGSSSEKMQNFCSNYQGTFFQQQNVGTSSDTVVVDALSLFNQCRALETKGITVEHDNAALISSVITVSFTAAVNYELQGVSTGKSIGCTYTPKDGDQVDLDTASRFDVESNFAVHCKRDSIDIGDGEEFYPRTAVTLASNQGPISFVYPAEEIVDIQYATLIANRLSNAETQLGNLTTALSELDSITVKDFKAHPAIEGNNNSTTQLIPVADGFCYLTKFGGHLRGPGEMAVIYKVDDYWTLRSTAGGGQTRSSATCVSFER